mmetsp:Transcript_9756/g.16191  ORF Transcript_9756/g.16191 Transcript_9756/m.16191 type:complete len:646 (+) Transcript_9756:220-2157(+)
MNKISNGLKRLAKPFGRQSEAADSNPIEESKESFDIFGNILEEDEEPTINLRMDSNGFIKNRTLSMLPPMSNSTMKYFLKDKIGEGAYGKVYRSVDTTTKKEYAIKISKLTDDNREYLMDELELLKKLRSPHIVMVYEGFTVISKLWLVMEHCIGGSILDVMKMSKIEALNEPLLKGVIASLLVALDFLHRHRVIHRDIKASNLVLTVGGRIKVIDFGVSAELKEGEECKNTVIGSPYWMAPEVIEGSDYNAKADVWSLGMTMLELCEPKHPMFSVHPVSVLFKIVTADPPRLRKRFHPEFSSGVDDFFSKCMQKDPAERKSSSELLAHEWLQKTVNDIVAGDEKNSPGSSVDALEQLFIKYVLDDEVDVLSWDEEDELEATQNQFAPDGNNTSPDKLSSEALSSEQLLPPNNKSSSRESSDKFPQELPRRETEIGTETSAAQSGSRAKISRALSRQGSVRSDYGDAIVDPYVVSTDDVSIVLDSSPDKKTRHQLDKKVSFASETSEDEMPRRQTRSSTASRRVSLHSHPNAIDSEAPSMLATPPSLRQAPTQNYIQRLLTETAEDTRPRSSTYRSLCSFDDTISIGSKSIVTSTSRESVRSSMKGRPSGRQRFLSSACMSSVSGSLYSHPSPEGLPTILNDDEF